MTRISMDILQSATAKIRTMDLQQKEQLAAEIFQHQPHMLGLVLVQHRLGVSMEKIDFLLTFLLTCFQAMKDSGLKWSKITEDEIDRQMNIFVKTVNFSKDMGNSLKNKSIQQYTAGHPELALLAFAQVETDNWLKSIMPEESDKNIVIAAMTLVNCIASARLI